MVVWDPPRETVRMKNGTVLSVSGSSAVVRLDGGRSATVPVYGAVSVGQGVLVLEQGGSLLVLGNPAMLLAEVEELRARVAVMEARMI